MRWEPELINRIRALHASGAAEVRWATTWCAFADQLERLWNLPVLGRAFTEPINGDVAAKAKAAAALNVVADGHRLIWTDDMEAPASGELYDKLTANGRSLLIAPRSNRGLRPDDMDAIEAFANSPRKRGRTVGPELTKENVVQVPEGSSWGHTGKPVDPELIRRVAGLNWEILGQAGDHRYLSTGCLHGEHEYCQSNTGAAGTKTPAQCKFCKAPCICPCHEPSDELDYLLNIIRQQNA